FQVPVRPISLTENLQVYSNVNNELMKMPAFARTPVQEHTMLAREILKKATTSDVGVEDPAITDPMMDLMTADEILHLYHQYVMVMDKCNPALEKMTKEDVVALVAELKKKGS